MPTDAEAIPSSAKPAEAGPRRPGVAWRREVMLAVFVAGGLGVVALAAWRLHQVAGSVAADDRVLSISRRALGTNVHLMAVRGSIHPADARTALEDAFAEVQRVDGLMSLFDPASELCRLNAAPVNQPIKVDPELMEAIRLAQQFTQSTAGAFDPTARPLFALWKQAGKDNRLPSPQAILAARSHCGWDKFVLGDDTVTRLDPASQIDLNGLAAGFAADKAVARLQRPGLAGGMVDTGGEIRVFGRPPDGAICAWASETPSTPSGCAACWR